MGKFLALTLEARPIQTKSPKQTTVSIYVFILLAVLGASYLLLVNSLSTKGYEIKKLEKHVVELKEANKRLELESAALQSVQQIEEAVKVLNLVPGKGIKYPSEGGYAYDDIELQ